MRVTAYSQQQYAYVHFPRLTSGDHECTPFHYYPTSSYTSQCPQHLSPFRPLLKAKSTTMRPICLLGLLFSCASTTFGVYAPRLIQHAHFTAIVADIGRQVDQGYAENVHGYASTWACKPNGRCSITFCYHDHHIKDRFQEYVEQAIKL
jgi:hypothetical protein